MTRGTVVLSSLTWSLLLGGCSPSTCVAGTAQACVCTSGAPGSQTCSAAGAFGGCVCDGVDASVPMDAAPDGGSIPDAAPTPDSGSDVDAHVDLDTGTPACASPLIACEGACIDPMSSPDHCGASGDCTGASAGDACTGRSCSGGRCVFDDCASALAAGHTTDGIYLVDVDGPGGIAPADAYCDMTAAGGGWTLVYKVGNTVPDVADPWWPMVAIGSGTALPTTTTPLASGTYFEGPTGATRAAFHRIPPAGYVEFRAQLVAASGATIFDVRGIGLQPAVSMIASGASGSPSTSMSTSDLLVIGTSGALPPVGAMGDDHTVVCESSACHDQDELDMGGGSVIVPLMGDAAISRFGAQYANTTTLVYTRPHATGAWP